VVHEIPVESLPVRCETKKPAGVIGFLIHCARHFSSRLPPSDRICKYAKVPSTNKALKDSLPIDMLLSAVSVLVVAQSSSEVPEGLMNNPVYVHNSTAVM
jgi:hypothetical protein